MDSKTEHKSKNNFLYLWMIHFDVWQKLTQYYKTIILQLKINTLKKKVSECLRQMSMRLAW